MPGSFGSMVWIRPGRRASVSFNACFMSAGGAASASAGGSSISSKRKPPAGGNQVRKGGSVPSQGRAGTASAPIGCRISRGASAGSRLRRHRRRSRSPAGRLCRLPSRCAGWRAFQGHSSQAWAVSVWRVSARRGSVRVVMIFVSGMFSCAQVSSPRRRSHKRCGPIRRARPGLPAGAAAPPNRTWKSASRPWRCR